MNRLIALEDAAARDPLVAGAKAAQLARARSAGLPVLPGWVVPVDVGAPLLRAGCRELAGSGRPHAAYLSVSGRDLEEALRGELAEVARSVGCPSIVRSSAVQESDPRWSGAFATYLEVEPDELPAAVRGCWASVFLADPLARCAALGMRVDELAVAVLLQPWTALEGGGTARLLPDGRVLVAAVAGHPSALVSGRSAGALLEVAPDGSAVGEADLDGLWRRLLAGVAGLARDVASLTGDDAIEWGVTGSEIVLLQSRAAPAPFAGAARPRPRPSRALPADAGRVASLADRFPAPLGDELVLPWALGQRSVPEIAPIRVSDPARALAEARGLAASLTAAAWGADHDAAGLAGAAIRSILGADPAAGIARLARLRAVDPAAIMRLLGLVRGIGEALAAEGRLPHPDLVWRLSSAELEVACGPGGAPPARLGPDRWEPFVFGVVREAGRARTGTPAAPGIGAGRLRVLDGRRAWSPPEPRRVLAVREPVAQVAPFLWNCAGLVAARGGAGAHLFEVARSLGVPAVAGVELSLDAGSDDVLVAVDGAAGEVSLLPCGARDLDRKGA